MEPKDTDQQPKKVSYEESIRKLAAHSDTHDFAETLGKRAMEFFNEAQNLFDAGPGIPINWLVSDLERAIRNGDIDDGISVLPRMPFWSAKVADGKYGDTSEKSRYFNPEQRFRQRIVMKTLFGMGDAEKYTHGKVPLKLDELEAEFADRYKQDVVVKAYATDVKNVYLVQVFLPESDRVEEYVMFSNIDKRQEEIGKYDIYPWEQQYDPDPTASETFLPDSSHSKN